jgi:hypothetical protein
MSRTTESIGSLPSLPRTTGLSSIVLLETTRQLPERVAIASASSPNCSLRANIRRQALGSAKVELACREKQSHFNAPFIHLPWQKLVAPQAARVKRIIVGQSLCFLAGFGAVHD